MHEIQQPPERFGQRLFGASVDSGHRVLEHALHAEAENAVLGEKMPSSGSPTRTGVSARSAC